MKEKFFKSEVYSNCFKAIEAIGYIKSVQLTSFKELVRMKMLNRPIMKPKQDVIEEIKQSEEYRRLQMAMSKVEEINQTLSATHAYAESREEVDSLVLKKTKEYVADEIFKAMKEITDLS